jgi:predicted Zn-dependent protease
VLIIPFRSLPWLYLCCTAILLLLATTRSAHAQIRLPISPDEIDEIPYFDPERLIDSIFGEEPEAQRAKLQQIPISPREEAQAGEAGVDQLLRQFKRQGIPVQKRGPDVRYVQRLVAELRPLMQNADRYRRIRVLVADDGRTDARSFPGGTVVVYRGLIDFCESEAALVGVLGHELSHVDRGHQLYHLRRWKAAEKSLTREVDVERFLDAGGMVARMFLRPFRPEEEAQADLDGAGWAFQLGYDPAEMARIFLRMHERDGQRPNFVPSFLQSHPFHDERFAAIVRQSDLLRRQNPDAELYVGRTNLEKRIPRMEREFSDRGAR